jgi:hypothetical protein
MAVKLFLIGSSASDGCKVISDWLVLQVMAVNLFLIGSCK